MAAFSFIWKICVCMLVYVVPLAAYENLFATKGQHFETTLKKDNFFKGEKNIEFTVSLDEMPDLPTWLKFEQKNPWSDGLLYGTPDDEAYTIGLAIVGWNKETYETFHKVIMVSVLDKSPNITHQIEMKIKNNVATDLIRNPEHFLEIINSMWSGARHISYVERPTHRGIKSDKGVFVGIAGNSMYPDELKILKENCNKKPFEDKVKRSFVDAGYNIDWCAFKDLKQDPITNKRKFDFDESSKYFDAVLSTSKWDDTTSDLTLDIIYVFIAVFIGLLLIAFITSVMFCHREGLQERNDLTPKEQLLHHKALRRAGAQIRNMSSGKDEESNGFPYGKLDEDSKYGTISSKKLGSESESSPSPPPYRNDRDGVKIQNSKF